MNGIVGFELRSEDEEGKDETGLDFDDRWNAGAVNRVGLYSCISDQTIMKQRQQYLAPKKILSDDVTLKRGGKVVAT